MSGFSIFFSWFGCTQMQEPGAPFSAVEIANNSQREVEESSLSKEVSVSKEKINPLFAPVGEVLVVSDVSKEETSSVTREENKSNIKIMISEEAQQEKEQVVEKPTETISVDTSVSPQVLVEEVVPPSMAKTAISTNIGFSAWPLRVVKTETDLTPPRAILGLANGEEVVVKAGTQLPNEQLVVMSIGKKGVVLARIVPTGDHVQIENITLMSLND